MQALIDKFAANVVNIYWMSSQEFSTPLRQSWSKKGMRSRQYQSRIQKAARGQWSVHTMPYTANQLTIWNWIGTTRKFRTWTAGQMRKLALRVGMYTSWNLRVRARRPPPSVMVIKEKKHTRPSAMELAMPSITRLTCAMGSYQTAQIKTGPPRPVSEPV